MDEKDSRRPGGGGEKTEIDDDFESSGFCWVLTDKRPTLKRPTSKGALGLVYSRPKIRLLSNCIMGVKNRHW